jgi:MFS family permease
MTISRCSAKQPDRSGYLWSSAIAPQFSFDRLGPLVRLRRKGYQGRSPWLVGITLPALTFALTIDRVFNGLTRPFFGWVSDFLGRENTMIIAFLLEGVGIWALYVYVKNPQEFVLLSGLVFFA